jgi:thiol:disulfide interchange protein DsbD
MMKKLAGSVAALMLFVVPVSGSAIEFDQVKNYEDVFRISARAISADLVEVSWDIEPGYYLYNNKFLRFTALSDAVQLEEAIIPEGKKSFDPLLDEEVIKFHGRLSVSIPFVAPGLKTLDLDVRSQGCLEDVLCYPPTTQKLSIDLSGVTGTAPASSISELFGDSPAVTTPGIIESAQPLQPDDAFSYEAIGLSAETILVRFTAQPGYYLYIDKFQFRIADADGFEVRSVSMPEGTIKMIRNLARCLLFMDR